MSDTNKTKCIWTIFSDSGVLLEKDLTGTFRMPSGQKPPLAPAGNEHVHEFVMHDGTLVRAFKVEDKVTLPDHSEFISLRSSFDLLPFETYEVAGKMEELIYWDKRNHYCGVCGTPLEYDTAISKKCPHCGHTIWPQLQIAIIVLVKRDNEILMVQSKNFRADYMGLVAGFVETGETLEQCAEREVEEEANIKIKNLKYFRSQAWPYPCGLMVGFVAEYDKGHVVIQHSELNKGGWYNRNAMPAIPSKVSLARMLIDAWMANEI